MNRCVKWCAVILFGVLVSGCYLEGDIESLRPKKRYTVTFDGNGGSGTVPDSQTVKTGSDITLPHQGGLSYDGYGFGGWNTKADGEGTHYNAGDSYTINDNVTLYAVWGINTYTVAFNAKGGSEVESQSVIHGGMASEPEPPVLDGSYMEGWYSDSELKFKYNFTTPVTKNITLYAKWIPEDTVFTVTFESNGGSPVAAQSVRAGNTATRPDNSIRDGFFLEGWYRDSELNNRYDFVTPVTEDCTLYAKWIEIPADSRLVAFNSNGGSFVSPQQVVVGSTASRPDDPARSGGYIFEGWYTDDTYANEYDFDDAVINAITLYAKWTGDIAAAIITVNDVTYNREAQTPAPSVVHDGKTLSKDTDYTVTYSGDTTNAGTATVTITAAANGNYTGTNSANFTIGKAAGAAITLSGTPTGNSITVTAEKTPDNDQAVEYAQNTANTAPADGWQDSSTFENLVCETDYYIFARAKESGNYTTGTASGSLNVKIEQHTVATWTQTTAPSILAEGEETGTCTVCGESVTRPIAGSMLTSMIDVVRINAGTFQMGSPTTEPGYSGETLHSVTLTQGFYMGTYQVTQGQYVAVMGSNPSYFTTSANGDNPANRPVEQVSWYDAIVFCNKLSMIEGLDSAYRINGETDPEVWGSVPTSIDETWNAVEVVEGSNGYRLPTEAQWEYACRAGTTTAYNWGTDTISSSQANYNIGRTTEVGSYDPNDWGLYDMHGNVWEWCWDWYSTYASGAQSDPMGASSGSLRVLRGGGWYYYGQYLRSAYRSDTDPNGRNSGVGFRLLRP